MDKVLQLRREEPQANSRSVIRLVKLWSLDESCLADDMAEVRTRLHQPAQSSDVGEQDQPDTRVGGDDQPVQGAVDGDHPVQGANVYEQAGCLTEAGSYRDDRKDCAIKVSFLGYFKKETNVHSPDPESRVTDCSPCDVSVLLVNSNELENIAEEVESQSEVDISSLYSIITSTGFML